jgi:uncharacterized protein DUF6131
MIIGGLALIVLGWLLGIGILVTLGTIVLVIGVVLLLIGAIGHPLGGRRHYY